MQITRFGAPSGGRLGNRIVDHIDASRVTAAD
jgi:hypothetical protein